MMYCDDMDVCLERVLVHFGANHMTQWNRSSSSKPVSVILFGASYMHARRHTYTGHRDRDTPTWAMAGLGALACH